MTLVTTLDLAGDRRYDARMVDPKKRTVRVANDPSGAGSSRGDGETVQSVDRALAIVELLLRSDPLSVREVALGTGINRTTAHRLVTSLHRRGWIERAPESGGHRPSLRFLALVRASLDRRDFVDEVRPTLAHLSLLSRETAHLGILDNHEVLHVDKVDSPEIVGVSSRIGTRAIPHVTGLGKALLAAGTEEDLGAYVAHARATRQGLTDPEALRREIVLVRQRGYSVDDGESSPGVRCLAVAICGADERPLFAISLTGPSGRFTEERLGACVPEMLAVARALSARFGGDVVPAPEAVA